MLSRQTDFSVDQFETGHIHPARGLVSANGEANLRVGKLQWLLHAALENARRIDNRSIECTTDERLHGDHLQGVRAVVEDAIVVLNAVIGHYDREADVTAAAESGVFHSVFEDIVTEADGSLPHQRIADVAFMARWELVRKLDSLVVGEHLDHWDLIAACGSALRRVVKAISGVERVLAEVEERPSMFTGLFQTQTEEAVLTRQAYVRLLSRLHDTQAQRMHLDITRCLRLTGTALASLIGHEIYEALRIEDRRTLRALQQRVISWLRGQPVDRNAHELEGDRLLADACALGSLLLQVNRRPELVEHDRLLLEQLLVELDMPSGDKLDMYERLITIRGRDAELDELLVNFVELERWREPAARVLLQLRPW